jgi:hypothetical protein
MVPPRHSRVHMVPAQLGRSEASMHEVGWQHCAGTQSASEAQAREAATTDDAGGAESAGSAEVADAAVAVGIETVLSEGEEVGGLAEQDSNASSASATSGRIISS